MYAKWIGAILVVAGCGGFGFFMASGYRREERNLRQLQWIIRYMESELQFSLSPLPELCRQAGRKIGGNLKNVFLDFGQELDWQQSPDVYSCLLEALRKNPGLTPKIKKLLMQLGHTLGKFDLPGQLRELEAVQTACALELKELENNKSDRLRSYQTLGLCAGAALAILLI